MDKLVIASDFSYPAGGGTERHVLDTARYFSKNYEVSIVSPNWGKEEYEEINIDGITIYKFPARNKNRFVRVLRYLSKTASQKPDIVIAHYFLPSVSMLLLKFWGVKVFPVIHELQNIRPVSALILNAFEKVFVRTHLLKEKCIKLGIKPEKLIVTHHEINPMFKPQNLKKEYDVIYVSRISSPKGIDAFLDVVNENPHLKFCLVGHFAPEEKHIYEPKLKSKMYKNLYSYLSFISDEKLIEAYNKSKIFLTCSKKEGFGIAAVEAMACGLPVVASGAEGLSEAVGNYGIITHDYTKAINMLLSDKDEYAKYGQLSLERAKQLSFSNIMKIYDEVMK